MNTKPVKLASNVSHWLVRSLAFVSGVITHSTHQLWSRLRGNNKPLNRRQEKQRRKELLKQAIRSNRRKAA